MRDPSSSPSKGRGVIVLGGGGHARVLIDLARCLEIEVRCVLDDNPSLHGRELDGVPIVGGIDTLDAVKMRDTELVNAVGSAGLPTARRAVHERGLAAGLSFATLVHPSAVVSAGATLGMGVQVLAGAVVGPGAEMGDGVLINTKASIDHDTVVGPLTHIAPGATVCGGVKIGAAGHIGCGATIIQGVSIGEGVLIAAGAAVTRDVASGSRVGGVPAREL